MKALGFVMALLLRLRGLRFHPVSYWETDVEVDVSRETKPAGGGAAQPRSVSRTIRFTLER